MGMTVQAHWSCDGCDTTKLEEQGQVPTGWKAEAIVDLFIDAEDNFLDFKTPSRDNVKVLCSRCIQNIKELTGRPLNDDAQVDQSRVNRDLEEDEQAETNAPVDSVSDSSAVSPPERGIILNDDGDAERTQFIDPSEYDSLVDPK